MTREEATAYWKQRSEHIHNWLEENEDVDFIGEYVEAIDMAIEALSKPVVDITQRDLCKDISCEDCPFMKETCKLMDYVAYAEAVQRWIPCSERLPDVGGRCLLTLSNNVVAIGTLHSAGECEDDFGYIVSWGKRWHLEPASMMIAYPKDSVTAWMPLPTPYKGGDTE